MLKKIRSLKALDFKRITFNSDYEGNKKKLFFSSREVFFGKSLVDICLNDPLSIIDALKPDLKVIEENIGPVIDDILRDHNEQTMKAVEKLEIKCPNLILS